MLTIVFIIISAGSNTCLRHNRRKTIEKEKSIQSYFIILNTLFLQFYLLKSLDENKWLHEIKAWLSSELTKHQDVFKKTPHLWKGTQLRYRSHKLKAKIASSIIQAESWYKSVYILKEIISPLPSIKNMLGICPRKWLRYVIAGCKLHLRYMILKEDKMKIHKAFHRRHQAGNCNY